MIPKNIYSGTFPSFVISTGLNGEPTDESVYIHS